MKPYYYNKQLYSDDQRSRVNQKWSEADIAGIENARLPHEISAPLNHLNGIRMNKRNRLPLRNDGLIPGSDAAIIAMQKRALKEGDLFA